MAEKKSGSIFESVRFGIQTEDEIVIGALFPTKDSFKMLQMTTDQQPKAIISWSVLGVFRKKYKSEVLKSFQEEHNLNKIALERKGRGELAEVAIAGKRREKEEE